MATSPKQRGAAFNSNNGEATKKVKFKDTYSEEEAMITDAPDNGADFGHNALVLVEEGAMDEDKISS
ncbi:hypothetical protein Scep_005088 [Stephania cephalantha]|uniref:Uncharacterized protein n=1 Tax=Stephania cephalantha TaxID=152367 RepID=A0AAP0PXV6_9MAGN